MLSNKGYPDVMDVAGGIRAWNGHVAVGPEELGLEWFAGKESVADMLVAAYGLEAGLRDFYLSMVEKVRRQEIQDLFRKLSDIERIHQDRVFREYLEISGETVDRETFENEWVVEAMEGGLTTEEYLRMVRPDWDSAADILSLAMSIEAQALDLYSRAAEESPSAPGKEALKRIAEEERMHLRQLGRLLDEVVQS